MTEEIRMELPMVEFQKIEQGTVRGQVQELEAILEELRGLCPGGEPKE